MALGGTFKKADSNGKPKRRLVVSLEGLEKEGKTHFALTMPGPIAYQGMDIGTEGVIEKFQKDKEIWTAEYMVPVAKGDDQNALMTKALPIWDTFTKDYKDVVIPGLKAGKVRGGIWDTGTEIWELQRLARFGKLTQIMPHHYTALNAEYTGLVKEIYNTPGNMVILHKRKAEWKDNPITGKSNKTGNYERAGYNGTGFIVQVNAIAWRDPGGEFHVTVTDCRQNPAVAGLDLTGDMCTFPWLGMFVFPDTKLEDWQ